MKNIISLLVFLLAPIISIAQPYGYTPRTGSGSSTFTGGTVTSTIVSTDGLGGPACDYSAGTNENLTFCMAGTGAVDFPKLVNTAGTSIDIFGEALKNTDTQICNGVAGTGGEFCINDVMMVSSAGNTYLRIWPSATGTGQIQINYNGTASNSAINIYDVTGAVALRGSFGYGGSTFSDADFQSRLYMVSYSSSQIAFMHDADLGVSTIGWNWLDNAAATAVSIMNLDGDGTLSVLNNIDTYGTTGPNTFRGPVVMTGDNASGTGTLRIRPTDEDTQLVLCEASNNSAPETCSSVQHYNASSVFSSLIFGTNIYLNSAGAPQRNNTSFGSGYIQTAASTTLGSNGVWFGAYNTTGTIAGYVNFLATGAATTTFKIGDSGVTTTDIRGPIINGGVAACDGSSTTGGLCFVDDTMMISSANAVYYARASGTTGLAASVYGATTLANNLQVGWFGSSSDADYASSLGILAVGGVGLQFVHISDIAAGVAAWAFKDNAVASGVTLLEIEGDGSLDIRGSIKNDGSSTCDGLIAGSLCISDLLTIHTGSSPSSAVGIIVQNTSNTGSAIFQAYTDGDAFAFQLAYGNGAVADADFAVKTYLLSSTEQQFSRTDDVAAGTIGWRWVDGTSTSATLAGNTLMGLYGDGTLGLRNAIRNDSSVTCNGIGAGSLCVTEDNTIIFGTGTTETLHVGSTAATSNTQIWEYAQGTNSQATTLFVSGTMAAGTVIGAVGFYGSGVADADYADNITLFSVGKTIGLLENSQKTATQKVLKVMDNIVGTGEEHLAVYGAGTVAFPQTQTVTCADNAGGTNQAANLDPQAVNITITNNDATGCDITMQETSAIIGAIIVICVDPASTATNVNFADVANVFDGAAPALSQGDCITVRYFDAANDLWLQTGISNN